MFTAGDKSGAGYAGPPDQVRRSSPTRARRARRRAWVFVLEAYRRSVFSALALDHEFVQDKHSRSRRGIVRGMHFQPGMGKLVRCLFWTGIHCGSRSSISCPTSLRPTTGVTLSGPELRESVLAIRNPSLSAAHDADALLALRRFGRGASYHEFELAWGEPIANYALATTGSRR
jgi:hypothetical protein